PSLVRLWDAENGKELRQFGPASSATSWFQPLAFSADSKTLAAHRLNTIALYDVATGNETRQLPGFGGTVFSLAFSPDGKTLAAGSTSYFVALWNTANWQLTRQLSGHKKEVVALAFSPNGNTLASWSGDRTLRLWELGVGKERRIFFVGPPTGTIG